jgi:WD40 repeat protein
MSSPVARTLFAWLLLATVPFTHGQPPGSKGETSGGKGRGAADSHGDPLPAGAVARMGTVRLRHGSAAPGGWGAGVAYAPDGKTLFSSSGTGPARQWDAATGKELRRFDTPGGTLAFALSPDGKILATTPSVHLNRGGPDLLLWDVTTGRLLRSTRAAVEWAIRLRFTPDGKALLAERRYGGGVRAFDVASGKDLGLWGPPEARSGLLALSRDGKLLASVDGTSLQLLETATGKRVRALGNVRDPMSLAFFPDGQSLGVVGSFRLAVWDVARGERLHELDRLVGCWASSPDGRLVAAGDLQSDQLTFWEPASGKSRHRLRTASEARPAALNFSPDGKTLAVALTNGTVQLREVATGTELLASLGHGGGLLALSLSPDGRKLATAGLDRTLRVWGTATGKALWRSDTAEPVVALAFSPDGATLFAGDWKKDVTAWDVPPGRKARRFHAGKPGGWEPDRVFAPFCIALSPDGKLLATGGMGSRLGLWDARTGRERRGFTKVVDVIAAAFSPDGRRLATVSDLRLDVEQPPGVWRYQVSVWDLATGKQVRQWQGEMRGSQLNWLRWHQQTHALAFSPDGARLGWVNLAGGVQLWDVGTGKELPAPSAGGRGPGPWAGAAGLAFSPDGRTLATGSLKGGAVHLWEVATGRKRAERGGHRGCAYPVQFSADGRYLVSGSDDTTALVWRLWPR